METFIITILFLISFTSSNNCPSNKYVFCADAGQNCYVPGSIKSGYISYGHADLYVLIPFANSHSNDVVNFIMFCYEWLGFPGSSNDCCYMESSHDFELIDESDWSFYHSENYNIPYPGNKALTAWRWGGNIGDGSHGGMYIYSVWSGFGPRNTRTENAWMYPMNDHGGLYSSWSTYSQLPTAVKNSNWQYCANEYQNCDITGGPRWVRYGVGDDWSYRLVSGKTFNCNYSMFKTGYTPSWFSGTRYCQKGPVLRDSFSHIIGEWKNCVICGGGCNSEITIKFGVTNHEEHQLTDEWTLGLELTASGSYSFGGFGGTVELKTSISNTVTETDISSWSKTKETITKVSCADPNRQKLCQFITNIKEEDIWGNSLDFEIKSQSYWCLSDDGLIPQCPPGFCQDDDCQICSESLTL